MPNEEGTQVVNEEAVQNTATTDSATVENNSSNVEDQAPVGRQTDSGEIVLEKPEAPAEEKAPESSESTEEAEGEEDNQDPQKRGAEARKEQLNTEIRDLVGERNRIRAEVEQLNAEVYKPASTEELTEQINPETGEYYNRLEAQLESMRQEREVEKYNNQVAETRLGLSNEAQRALQEFPMFDEASPEYDAEAAANADAVLAQSLIFDPNTQQIIGSHVSPYMLYKSIAASAQASAKKAEIQGQRNVEKMLSQTDAVTGGQGKSKTFDKMSLTEQEAYLRKRGHDV